MSKKLQFLIGEAENGTFFAATNCEPFFCFERSSQEDAVNAALAAWTFYLECKSHARVTAREASRSNFTSRLKNFIPKQVVFAEAYAEAC